MAQPPLNQEAHPELPPNAERPDIVVPAVPDEVISEREC
jgi:hypothetical protein